METVDDFEHDQKLSCVQPIVNVGRIFRRMILFSANAGGLPEINIQGETNATAAVMAHSPGPK